MAETQDCWWLVREIYQNELGIEIPRAGVQANHYRAVLRAFQDSPLYQHFQRIDTPQHLCVVILGVAHPQEHCGIYLEHIDQPILLHNQRFAGVCAEPFHELRLRDWKIHSYWKLTG